METSSSFVQYFSSAPILVTFLRSGLKVERHVKTRPRGDCEGRPSDGEREAVFGGA